jgi:hypothetical protein
MSVRAKFFVQSVKHTATASSEVVLAPVCRGEDNKEWAKYTPAGLLMMHINNEQAVEQFTPGEEFYLDFTPAPKGKEGMNV